MNRNLLISIILGLILIGVGGGYFIWYKSGPIAPAPVTARDSATGLPAGTPKATRPNDLGSPTTTPETMPGNAPLKKAAGLTQLTNQPVADIALDIYSTASSSVIYIEKTTGHIYQINSVGESIRLSNTTITKINRAWFGLNKKNINPIINYTNKDGGEHWFNAILKLSSTTDNELIGSDLDPNIVDLAISPTRKEVFYLRTENQNMVGAIYNLETGKTTIIFRSILRDWNSAWNHSNLITLNTKPAALVFGLINIVNTKNYQATTYLNNNRGLTSSLSPDGAKILFGYNSNFGSAILSVYQITQNTKVDLPLKTLPEKCAWSKNNIEVYCGIPNPLPNSSYPDQWYSGETSFKDTLWRINTLSGTSTVLINPGLAGISTPIDATKLTLDRDEKNLFLINKNDLTLWVLDLTK